MKADRKGLAGAYRAALESYLAGAAEAGLQRAYELGRRAIESNVGLLEMAALHHEVLMGVLLQARGSTRRARAEKEAGDFFVESLSPYEMTHRGFSEANTALRRLNETLEEQAKRIAHALHDESGQLLASVHLALEEISQDLPEPSRERLRSLRGLLDQIEEQIRRFSHELRPTILDDLGLLPAMEFLARGFTPRTGIPVGVESTLEGRLAPPSETTLYRILQEALNNVARHSRARSVQVQLKREKGTVRFSVRDDGIGFDPSSVSVRKGHTGLGLVGIRERVDSLKGHLQILSSPGGGTELLITFPAEN